MPSDRRFEEIAERYLNPIIRGNEEFMCECPFCGGAATLQFNIDKGLWNCFKCEAKGNAEMLVRRLGGTYSDPAIGVEALYRQIDRMRIAQKKKDKGQPVLDENYLKRFAFDDPYWTDIRGFSKATVERWDLGFDPIADRHTIAYRNEHGELLGIIYRLKGSDVPIRYIYPEGFDRKNSLYGSWMIEGRKSAIVEGSTDVHALDDASRPAVAQYGSSISKGQTRLLHRIGLRELVMFYDYDEAGIKAEEKSRQVLGGFVLRTVVWDKEKYCWHRKLCGCGEHTWRNIAKCEDRKLCDCGRQHGMDPGTLKKKERRRMYDEAVLIGSKKEWKSIPPRSASSRNARSQQ